MSDWLIARLRELALARSDKETWDRETTMSIPARPERDVDLVLSSAADEIDRLRDAANVALGHLTGGMDGDWRDCDPIELLREALAEAANNSDKAPAAPAGGLP